MSHFRQPELDIHSSLARLCRVVLGGLLIVASTATTADNAKTDNTKADNDGISAIELRRLLEPTPAEIVQEEQGRIYIYDGLRDTDIERAMSEEFGRIDHMMFIRVRKTDADGEILRDKATGEAIVDDDGC